MKRTIMFLFLCTNIFSQTNLLIGVDTTHLIKGNYELNEKNKLVILEHQKNKDVIGIASFKNSFFNNTVGIYYGRKKEWKHFYLIGRLALLKGYNETETLPAKDTSVYNSYNFKNNFVFYKDYSLIGTIGIGIKLRKNISIETNLLGDCISTSLNICM